MALDIQCIAPVHNAVGESPLWDADTGLLYWVDINLARIHRRAAVTGIIETWQFEKPVSAISLTSRAGVFLVATGGSIILWSPHTDTRTPFAQPETNWPAMRLNDGATDPNGNFWVGSMSNNVAPDGSDREVAWADGAIYRINAAGETEIQDRGFFIPNTVVWSPDGRRMYCGCSIQNTIWVYDYAASDSTISNRRLFIPLIDRGSLDGSAMDAEGFIWNCRWGGSAILRFAPDGRLDCAVEMPVSQPTHCAFGGPAMTTLYVTSAALGAPASETLAGGLFSIETNVRGLPTHRLQLGTH